jgi:ABC-2 type transport system permease protein
MVAFITILIVFGLFVGMESATRESREKISVFIQTLPISPTQYLAAKVIAALIAYSSVWVVMTVTVIGLSLAIDEIANGTVPITASVMGLLLANFCLLLAIGLITHSQRWTTAAIIITNTSITLLMITLFNLPAIQQTLSATEPVWHPIVQACIAFEALMILASFAIMLYVHSRRTDFI